MHATTPITVQSRVKPVSTKSDFNVEVVRITSLEPHPNADRLDIVNVNGNQVVIRKGDFKNGERAIYIPIDALVPLENPAFAFLASKSHPERTHHRVKAARLRGVYSEGLLVPLTALPDADDGKDGDTYAPGDNVQELLKVEKWLSPADRAEGQGGMLATPGSRRSRIAEFNKICPVYGLDSIVRFPNEIPTGTNVVLTEKIHGSNARYSFQKGRFWIGSHRTLRHVTSHRIIEWFKALFWLIAYFLGFKKDTGYYKELGDIWVKIAEQYHLEQKLQEFAPGLVVYGEIYGKGLQRRGGVDFVYDSPEGLKFRVFDIHDPATGTFLPYFEMKGLCGRMGLEVVPHVAVMAWPGNAEAESFTKGQSLIGPHIREGVVVRTDLHSADERKSFKFVSTDYKMLAED